MNFKQTLIAGAIIMACAIAYEYTNTYRSVAVWPSDGEEFTIKCYPLTMEVHRWDEKLFSTNDTGKVIKAIMEQYDSCLPSVLFSLETTFTYDSTETAQGIKKLLSGKN